MITKRKLADQVLYRYYGGEPDVAGPVQHPDVYVALEQKINGLFKLHQLDTNLPSGEMIPEGAMIGVYEGNTVVSENEVSYALVPIQPISLPKDMGIMLVYDPNYSDMPFIPLRRGQTALLRTDNLLSSVMGQISYTPSHNMKRVYFNKDLTTLGIDEITMEICVFDLSLYNETSELPIPADMEERLVNELYLQFSNVTPETGIVNPYTTANQKAQQ